MKRIDPELVFEWPQLGATAPGLRDLVDLAHGQFCAYYETGSQEKLKNWVNTLASITEAAGFNLADPDFRAGIFYRYGIGLQWFGVHSGQTALFAVAKKAWVDAVSLTTAHSPLNIRSRYNIAITEVNSFRFSGDARVLDNAIADLAECI